MKLYHSPFSSNSRKVAITAALVGIDLDIHIIQLGKGEQREPAFRALNPNGKVPVLEDGDFVLWESHAILTYLCDTKGGHTLYPTELRARADVQRWLFWTSNHWSPAIAGLNFENMLKKRLYNQEVDPAQVKRHETFFHEFARVLDDHLAKHSWLSGGALTIADIGAATSLMYAGPAKLPLEPYSHMSAWFERIRALDPWKTTEPPAFLLRATSLPNPGPSLHCGGKGDGASLSFLPVGVLHAHGDYAVARRSA